MHSIFTFLKDLYDSGHLQAMIRTGGIPVIAFIIFAETGLLVGFFLPGDTLLFLAGVAAATVGNQAGETYLNIYALTGSLIAAAILGDQLGYFLGYKTGHAIFTREDNLIFKRHHAVRAHDFYTKYGPFAIVAARFMPMFRTFVPFMAGVGEMRYPKFLLIDSFGGFLWITVVVWSGYLLGVRAEHQLKYILPGIAIVSMLPVGIGILKEILAARRGK